MVQLVLKLTAPPGGEPALSQTLRAIMLPAQLNRECLQAQLYVEAGKPRALYYVEEWLTEAQLVREVQSSRFGRLLEVMESAAEPPTLVFQFVQETRGLEFVAAARLDPPLAGE